ncbi:MAG: hypothetical protein FWD90_01985 [Defluviitaleaceae bacterium]|nr:hypothetical protein [Defluviitaleaceae bacterium]
MLDKQGYHDYLLKKKCNEKLLRERLWFFDELIKTVEHNGITSIAIITADVLTEFLKTWNVSGAIVHYRNASRFLIDYAKYIDQEAPNLKPLAAVINGYFLCGYEQAAKEAAARRKNDILPIPEGVQADPKHLGVLSNEEFTAAFRQLQQIITDIYEDIEKDPFAWGYPDYETTDGYYNRVVDILFAFIFNGICHDGAVTVDAKAFFNDKRVKRHKKVELMVAGFENRGFFFEGYGKKSESFRASYPGNPNVITALHAYVSEIDDTKPDWAWGKPLHSFSYRYIEDPAAQKYERVFHAEMDYASDKLREIQEWLHAEAKKYGFAIDPKEHMEKGCILYKKGSKRFLLVRQGERKPDAGHFDPHETKIGTKVSFIHAFEKSPDKMRALVDRFPRVFNLGDRGTCCKGGSPHMFKAGGGESSEKRCTFRMLFTFEGVTYTRCGLNHFFFQDISFDDAKAILEMFLIENGIK